jgi:hypothetical protein
LLLNALLNFWAKVTDKLRGRDWEDGEMRKRILNPPNPKSNRSIAQVEAAPMSPNSGGTSLCLDLKI